MIYKEMDTVDGPLKWAAVLRTDGNVDVNIIMDESDEVYTDVKNDPDHIMQIITDFLMAKVDDLMSNTEYVANYGDACPVCESSDVVAMIPLNPDDADMECESCGATWINTYELTGYDNLTKGDE